MSEHDFCRSLLTTTMQDVNPHTTVEQRKKSWGYVFDSLGSGEFHGPDDFYWHGNACCLWSARSNGWDAWLTEKGLQE